MLARIKLLLIVVGALCLISNLHAESRHYIVDIPRVAPEPGDYIVELLRMSLDASKADDEIIDLRFADYNLSQERLIAEVRRGDTNSIMWTISTKAREKILRPIRIPLFKGLLGYRALVIRKQDEALFAQVNSLTQLAQFTAGQGADWPDTPILRANQLPVVEGTSHENLYKMLVAQRFDYFPRGITETREEESLIRQHDVMVAPHLILYYPTVMYFFVNKSNQALAERVEKGLNLLIERGDYDKLFYALPRVQAALAELNDEKRAIIALHNPDISRNTKTYPPEYWRSEVSRHFISNPVPTNSRH